MRQLTTIILILYFVVPAYGQNTSILKIKAKGDSVLKSFVGINYIKLSPELKEIRTTDKYGVYHYFEFTNKKAFLPNSNEYLFTYSLKYPHLDYTAEIEFLVNSRFRITDSSGLSTIPDYIIRNKERDIILPSKAIEIAKNNGLAKGDTVEVFFARHYKTKDYYWHVESAWKAQLESERKANDGRRRRAPNSHLLVNAKTGKVLTWTEFGEL